jgi:hypothetical protein
MKTAVFALTLAMLVGAPLIASASTEAARGTNRSLRAVNHPMMQQQGAPKQTVWTLSQARPHNGPKRNPSNFCNA